MMEHEPDPLPDDVRALLDAERTRPSVPPPARDRLLRRVEASVAVLAIGAGAAVTAHAIAHGTLAKTSIFANKIFIAICTFLLGGAVGAGTMYVVKKAEPPRTVYVDRPAAVTATAPAPTPSVQVPTPVAPAPSAAPSAPPATPSAAKSAMTKDEALAAERALIEMARTALSRNEAASALDALDVHRKRFPGGQLTEEREALSVQALVKAGRHAEAKSRGAAFKKRYPTSMLLPVVDAALEAIP